MTTKTPRTRPFAPAPCLAVALLLTAVAPGAARAQDRLKRMPGYDRYQKVSRQIPGSYRSGALTVTWADDGKSFEYRKDGKPYRFDVAAGKAEEVKPGEAPKAVAPRAGRRGGRGRVFGLERGRQAGSVVSPDGTLKAFYRGRNLWLSDPRGAVEKAITTDGSEAGRIKNGTASWVYGEELDQITAIWWSPDGKRVAFYRFDESKVPDYYLQLDQTRLMSKVDAEPYPKAGAPNPVVDLLIYDVDARTVTRADVRDGKPFTDDAVGHYVYNVEWSPDGKDLLFRRTNRRQNVLELAACDPTTGKCRVVVREEWPTGWVENNLPMQFLKDGKRFLWTSERTGWQNLYLYDLSGKLHAAVTAQGFEAGPLVRVDEEAGEVDYLARSGDNPLKVQLHRASLDGKNDRRLTDPSLHHSVDLAPDGKHFIDVAQTHDRPPVTRLVCADGCGSEGHGEGCVVAELAHSDLSKFEELGLHKTELLKFKAADGETDLFGSLWKPSDFDPDKKYPLLVDVYAGPLPPSMGGPSREVFRLPSALTEYGFLVASFDARSGSGRGRRFLDAVYQKLGRTEIDDQAAGVKSLYDRPYFDRTRVGIHGSSYGGYASIMCLLRHPDVYRAACASSPVTDWKNYDTIYTERYMWTPQGNKESYEAGSALAHVDKLKGRLMLFYGTADNNVHPSNAMQLVQALQRAGKSFDLQIGPDQGHSAIGQSRMMEFFIENLVMDRP